jgi:hypothetical protein
MTDDEFLKFKRAVILKLKFLEGLIDDLAKKIADDDDRLTQNVDEAIDRSNRAQRAVRRLQKEFDEHEHEEAVE